MSGRIAIAMGLFVVVGGAMTLVALRKRPARTPPAAEPSAVESRPARRFPVAASPAPQPSSEATAEPPETEADRAFAAGFMRHSDADLEKEIRGTAMKLDGVEIRSVTCKTRPCLAEVHATKPEAMDVFLAGVRKHYQDHVRVELRQSLADGVLNLDARVEVGTRVAGGGESGAGQTGQ